MTQNPEDLDEGAEPLTLRVPPELAGERFDKALAVLCPELSRTRIKALMLDGAVASDGQEQDDPSRAVKAGEIVTLIVPPPVEAVPKAEDIKLDIVFEDGSLLVINKPAGMVVHPGAGNYTGTLVNALLHHCRGTLSGIGGVLRPGIVHRLDKDTSGLMIVAKNDSAHRGLSEQLSDRSLSRTYDALVWKVPSPIKGAVNVPVGRSASNRLKMAAGTGREAVTDYLMTKRYGEAAALVQCSLRTGRTHQIRVHMAHIRHPVLGDPLYGLPRQESLSLLRRAGCGEAAQEAILGFARQALHARKIRFIHPETGEEMAFEAPWPEDFRALENHLKSIG